MGEIDSDIHGDDFKNLQEVSRRTSKTRPVEQNGLSSRQWVDRTQIATSECRRWSTEQRSADTSAACSSMHKHLGQVSAVRLILGLSQNDLDSADYSSRFVFSRENDWRFVLAPCFQ